jgi:hypothetical protein
MQGYVILNSIIAGQTLGVINSHLTPALGIVIIGLASLAVCSQLHCFYGQVWQLTVLQDFNMWLSGHSLV